MHLSRPTLRQLLPLLGLGLWGCATLPPRDPLPADWQTHRLCRQDPRPDYDQELCLELVALGAPLPAPRAIALLVPGMFQNLRIYDLAPERGISLVRTLRSQGLETYGVQVRGIGGSTRAPHSSLDEIVMDDLPLAIHWAHERAKARGLPLIVIGHSQGAMTLKVSLAGLTRCSGGPCFDPKAATARQSEVQGALFLAGSVALTGDSLQLRGLACAGGLLPGLAKLLFDRLPGRRLGLWADRMLPHALFNGLNRPENVAHEIRRLMLDRTVDGTSSGTLAQLGDGLGFGSVRSGETRWVDGLPLLKLPVVQLVFGLDPLSPPRQTFRDDFAHIGSPHKRFFMVPGLAHGDFQLSARLHHVLDRPLAALFANLPKGSCPGEK